MAWKDMLPTANLASLLERFFFPKWLQVLCTWLSSNPNYDEVTKWYTGWKSMLSEQLLAMPAIKGNTTDQTIVINHQLYVASSIIVTTMFQLRTVMVSVVIYFVF